MTSVLRLPVERAGTGVGEQIRRRKAGVLAHGVMLAVLASACVAVGLCGLAAPAHAAVSSVKVDGKVVYSNDKNVKVKKIAGVSYDAGKKKLTLKNVKLSTGAHEAVRIDASAKDTVKIKLKGTNAITASKANVNGVNAKCRLLFNGSNLTMTNMATAVAANNIVFKDGTYTFKKCKVAGVVGFKSVEIPEENIGSVSVTMLHPAKTAAIVAALGKVSNAPERLGTIAGRLGLGATFQHANSTYKVLGTETVKLVQYAGSKEANLESVTYGKYGYDIAEVGSGAFNNRIGKKVTKIVLGSNTRVIQQDAFKGTNLLTSMDVKRFLTNVDIHNWKSLLNSLVTGIDKKAFRSCGALSGARLTVHTGFSNADVNIAIKGAMTIKGMPLLVKFRK